MLLQTNWEGPYKVLEKISDVNYKVILDDGNRHKVKVLHLNQLKSFRNENNRCHKVVSIQDSENFSDSMENFSLSHSLLSPSISESQDTKLTYL